MHRIFPLRPPRLLWLLAALCLTGSGLSAQSLPRIGVIADPDQDSLLAAIGFATLTGNTQQLLSPQRVAETKYQENLPTLRNLQVPLYGTNLFIPGRLKVTGPVVDEAAVLAYADTVLRRAREAGVTLITWGSCGSRRVPEGFSRVRATAQFIHMAGLVARVAERYGVILALENLNTTECNFITTVPEALAVVRAVAHPNFLLCVDIYHMLVNGEPASDIAGVGPYAVYSELAEGEGRTPPGVHGVDFVPYLRALRREGFTGVIAIEARWESIADQGPAALATLREQVRAAYE